jgi:hypothetical protein
MVSERIFLIILLLAGAGGAYFLWHERGATEKAPPSPTTTQTASENSPAPPRYPIHEEDIFEKNHNTIYKKSLPSLDDSDAYMQEQLRELWNKADIENFFELTGIIRRIVITVDNVTAKQIPVSHLPLKTVVGQLRIEKTKGKKISIQSANQERYAGYIQMLQTVNTKSLVDLYAHSYPLFQKAYQEMGNAGYFNDRLMEAIDSLLATPEASKPIVVVESGISYKYADEDTEALPAGQKTMLRLGEDNEKIVKAKLKELRDGLTGLSLKH